MKKLFRKPSSDEIGWLRDDVRFGALVFGPTCTIAFTRFGISQESPAWVIAGLSCPFVALALLYLARKP